MSDVVNLNRFRKKKRAADDAKRVGENRTKFGRTKAEKSLAKSERERESGRLDAHELDADE